jgi:hypothetical protein
MIKTLYFSASGFSNVLSANISFSHSSSTSTATIICESFSGNIGDYIAVDLGYSDDHAVIFRGYVKQKEHKVPDDVWIITAHDVMIRALDYWLVSSSPENPFSRRNIWAEVLVRDVLREAGLTNYGYTPTYFRFATGEMPAEVNLVSAYDYSNGMADLLTWHIYADSNGKAWFVNRKPYVMDGASGQPGDVADSPVGSIDEDDFISARYRISEKDLRNRVVVYGGEGISATSQAASPYLPAGFFKTAALSSQIIATQSLAQDIANYNLQRWNRLTYDMSIDVLGDPTWIARRTINVTSADLGLSSEQFYIFSAEHRWSKEGYTVGMELRK